jgi:integrase
LDRASDVRKAIAEALGKLETSGGRDALVFDSDHRRAIPGFGLRVFSSGRAFFILKYAVKAQGTRRVSLNEVATNHLDQQLVRLRQAAEEIRDHARASGRDIVAERLKAEADRKVTEEEHLNAPTLRKLAPLYLRDRQRGKNDNGRELRRLKRNSLSQARRYLQGTLTDPGIWRAIADAPLPRIGMRHLQDILEEAARTRGAPTADRARAALSSFFSWAIELRHVDSNPTNDLKAQSLNKARERTLSEDELITIWRCCGDDNHGRIVRLLILTGSRREEIGGLRSSEIDRERRQVLLPAERCKNHREHLIPLTDEALALLPEHPSPFVFGRYTSGPFGGWSKSKAELDARISAARARVRLAPMEPWRVHDLRRSFVTHISERGFAQPHVVEALVNHISGHRAGVAGVYNKAVYLPERRRALERWARHITALVGA